MIGTLMGIIKFVAVVCLLLLVIAAALVLVVVVTAILEGFANFIFRRKK